jgi:CheY-like chemotaxis protein/signal transduction histidine kinase
MTDKHIILIVDDTPENLRVLGDMLEEHGYEVLVATSGLQALETVRVSPPHLILLDILMPEMDGYAVCRRLKADPLTQGIPVIFLSVLDMPEQKIQAFHEGAVDFITKPFQSEEVVARVQTHLRLTQIEVLQREIEQRTRVEEALHEQAEELSAIYDDAPLIMMIVNEASQVWKINSPISAFTSLPLAEIVGRRICEVLNCIHNADTEVCCQGPFCQECAISRAVHDTFSTGASHQQVQGNLQTSRDGHQQKIFFLLSTKRLTFKKQPAVLLCLLDISELHHLQDQVIQQQKLESLGTLAGGIAHDFNNILNAIIGYTDLAMIRNEEEAVSLHEDLGQVRKAANRATELVRQILTFSRKQHQEIQPLQISLIVKEALKLLRASIPTTIDIQHEITSRATVLADATHIHQMVMNLCTNAFHAMMERGGVLRVTLKEFAIDHPMIDSGTELPPGGYAMLSVSDTGCGMDQETMAKIFEPYFTTKEMGKGTGLGLAVVHGIVKGHQGRIAVYSEPGQGTTFNVYLPLIAKEMTEVVSLAAAPPPMAKNRERIMVVDDESAIRDLTAQFLLKAGYLVDTFSNGMDAFNALSQEPHGWDLVITDQTMPGMTGNQLAAQVLLLRPHLPIILCSGYRSMQTGNQGTPPGVFVSLQKPVDRNTLLLQVAKALEGQGAAKP